MPDKKQGSSSGSRKAGGKTGGAADPGQRSKDPHDPMRKPVEAGGTSDSARKSKEGNKSRGSDKSTRKS
jgi:hypothetical protein